ncbi:uncharacterized protein LODBEIA_P38220 [Lodderomyces beijingensis]|uniref:Peptide:N-glycanase 1 n=1 Tax=Lodderomyces beijingensis TaxID=1775926 RepID=A0ABP0ZN69_9ASCO
MADFKTLTDKLIVSYAKSELSKAHKTAENVNYIQDVARVPLINSIHSSVDYLRPHKDSARIDIALDKIDLAKIYANVDKLEKDSNRDPALRYDDLVVKELLRYFKHDFFKWVNVPECPCGSDRVVSTGAMRHPPGRPNPDQISIIEMYKCQNCSRDIQFPRINNAVSLLDSRRGRCGEWVNAFLLLLEALIGEGKDRVRYVWNPEDHVWCEYYSSGLKKWVHLDPCEAVFDEPRLYCENWGKKMSFVFGFNDNTVVDLSDKYITKEKKILTALDPKPVASTVAWLNAKKLVSFYQQARAQGASKEESLRQVYHEVIVPRNRELLVENKASAATATSTRSDIPQGRQTGSAEWTKARGESG